MCAIIGAVVLPDERAQSIATEILAHIWYESHKRGRDGRGYTVQFDDKSLVDCKDIVKVPRDKFAPKLKWPALDWDVHKPVLEVFIANLRAEPTTEWVNDKHKSDQQPYRAGRWTIVHNGTVANDKELRDYSIDTKIDSAAIAETLNAIQQVRPGSYGERIFETAIKKIKGSFAVLAHEQGGHTIFFACNYRPIWCLKVENVGYFLASSRDYFPSEYGHATMIWPYSKGYIDATNGGLRMNYTPLDPTWSNKKAIAICSGGLDSVVAATFAKKTLKMDVTLLHFHYGSRAQDPETHAIEQVSRELGCEVIYVPIDVYRPEDSPLLRADSKIAGGEKGAEFAYEWVPARNLLMLSMATAIAEARGAETLILGNNLEEAGAYPDNEPEFIDKFNDLLPFAIGDGKQLRVIQPVGNLMKHEIVKLGHELGAPMHATWSCYRAGRDMQANQPAKWIHCGTCGPCFMRRTAFKINDLEETVKYEI